MIMKQVFKEALVLGLLAVVTGLAVNHFSPRGIPLKGQWDKKKGVVDAMAKNSAVDPGREIELPEAVELFNKGVLFLDARDPEVYAAGHIRGALSLSVREFWEKIGEIQAQHPVSTPLVVYCSGRECPDSHDLAEELKNAGYLDVKVFTDGYPLWESERLPTSVK